MSGRLAGKVAVVTGVGAGIGRGIALRFAREGATVIGCDLNSETAAATVAAARAEGLALASLHPCDLTLESDALRLVQAAGAVHGRIDILVNAAAIAPHMARAADMSYLPQWADTMKGEVDIVFLGQRGDANGNAGEVDPFVFAEFAAVDDLADDVEAVDFMDAQFDEAV